MLDPWDCTNHGFDLLVEEYQEQRPKKKKKSVKHPIITTSDESDMRFKSKLGKDVTFDTDFINVFSSVYPESTMTRFYIFDTFENKYISTITNPKEGIISTKPAVFKQIEGQTFEFQDKYSDIRSTSVLERLYENILISVYRDNEYLARELIKRDEMQYRVTPFKDLPSYEFRKYCYIEYKDPNDELEFNEDFKEIVKSVCQLFRLFPGKEFYIFDIEKKMAYNVDNTLVEFSYTAGNIIYNVSVSDKIENYIKDVFTTIYKALIFNGPNHVTYPIRYKLIRKDELDKYDMKKLGLTELPIEKIFKENGIKKDKEYWTSFFLRTCSVDPKSLNILTHREGNTIKFIEFMYDNDDGLVATNIDVLDLDVSTLKEFEQQILDGSLVPIDIDKWNRMVGKKQILIDPTTITYSKT